MKRRACWFALAAGLWALAPVLLLAQNPVLAQDAAASLPPFPLPEMNQFPRGPGFYFSLTKLFLILVSFWIWLCTVSWVGVDAKLRKEVPGETWLLIVFGAGFAGLLGVFVIPWFWLGYPVLLAAHIVPVLLYARKRNAEVPPHEHVLTKDHVRFWLAAQLRKVGVKVAAEAKAAPTQDLLKLKPQGGVDVAANQVLLVKAKLSPQYTTCQEVLLYAHASRANQVLLDLTAQGLAQRYLVDGLWENADPLDLNDGKALIAVYKTLCSLNEADMRSRQEGKFQAETGPHKLAVKVQSAGTQTGERMLLTIDDGSAKKLESLPQIGVNKDIQAKLVQTLGPSSHGLFLVTAPPGGGLSTETDALLRGLDRFTRAFYSVEDKQRPERPVENVKLWNYDSAQNENPAATLPKLVREYPDVLVIRSLADAETLRMLMGTKILGAEKLVIACVPAKQAAEAPLRLLMLKDAEGLPIPPDEFAPHLLGVLNVRLVRKLCSSCKVGYEPQPQLLQQLGLASAGITELFKQYQPPTDPNPKKKPPPICDACNGRGYLGRTGMFELLLVNDQVRQVLATTPRLDLLVAAARQAGLRPLQLDGIRLVAEGVTSLEELQRVMKE